MTHRLQNRNRLVRNMKEKNLFWSYGSATDPMDYPDEIVIETCLKYGNEDDMHLLLRCFERTTLREVWQKRILPDNRFRKLNHYVARVVFNIEPDRLNRSQNGGTRFEKLQHIAAGNTIGT